MADTDAVVGNMFDRFKVSKGRLALLKRISDKLVALDAGESGLAAAENVARAIKRLMVDGNFTLPKDAVDKDDFQESFLGEAKNSITTALGDLGQSQLAAASVVAAGAIKLINTKWSACGGDDKTPSPKGPPIELDNGRHVILYWIEEDENKMPILPAIAGDARFARSRLRAAFESWEGVLNMDVRRTEDKASSNLVITGRVFGPEIDDSVLALTSIGPPSGTQLRMVFDLAETALSKIEFEATASHEFGHFLGVKHAMVAQSGCLMSPVLSSITEPTDADLAAAVTKGWQRT